MKYSSIGKAFLFSIAIHALGFSAMARGDDNDCNLALHRYWLAVTDHFYSIDWNEIKHGKFGYEYEGVAGYVCRSPKDGRLALHRYFNPRHIDHFYSVHHDPEYYSRLGYVYEGISGYVFAEDGPGRTPLYRYFHPGISNHFYTTNWNEIGYSGFGYIWEGVEGYVYGVGARRAVPPHLKHFGYYGTGFRELAMHPVDAIHEVAGHSSLVWLRYEDSTELLDLAADLDLQVVIDLADVFYVHDAQGPTARLRKDYSARWKQAALRLAPYKDRIYALTPLDEPFHHARKRGVSWDEMHRSLETLSVLMRGEFPTARMALIFTGANVRNPRFRVPASYDLIGFDDYGGEFAVRTARTLIAKSHPQQHLLLVPRAFQNGDGYGYQADSTLIKSLRQAYDFAATEPKVEAIVPFLWQPFASFTATRELPRVRTEHVRMGREISRK